LNVTVSFMTFLGRHSYAIYLTHFACAAAIGRLISLDLIPMVVLLTGASLGVSYYAIEPLFERHFNRLGHLLAARAGRPKTLASAA
jgi:peptidoglycan/LPS O-acetylase OafA/YrhL